MCKHRCGHAGHFSKGQRWDCHHVPRGVKTPIWVGGHRGPCDAQVRLGGFRMRPAGRTGVPASPGSSPSSGLPAQALVRVLPPPCPILKTSPLPSGSCSATSEEVTG